VQRPSGRRVLDAHISADPREDATARTTADLLVERRIGWGVRVIFAGSFGQF
jgi:hypothetical protein